MLILIIPIQAPPYSLLNRAFCRLHGPAWSQFRSYAGAGSQAFYYAQISAAVHGSVPRGRRSFFATAAAGNSTRAAFLPYRSINATSAGSLPAGPYVFVWLRRTRGIIYDGSAAAHRIRTGGFAAGSGFLLSIIYPLMH